METSQNDKMLCPKCEQPIFTVGIFPQTGEEIKICGCKIEPTRRNTSRSYFGREFQRPEVLYKKKPRRSQEAN